MHERMIKYTCLMCFEFLLGKRHGRHKRGAHRRFFQQRESETLQEAPVSISCGGSYGGAAAG